MVWCSVCVYSIAGPYFFDSNATTVKYPELLEELRTVLEFDLHFDGHGLVLQQHGTPCHFGLEVRSFLNNCFPGRIGGEKQ